jgi:hypothetical protein
MDASAVGIVAENVPTSLLFSRHALPDHITHKMVKPAVGWLPFQ